MIRVGITGQPGFVGTFLYNTLGLYPEEFDRIPFEDVFFQSEALLCPFVKKCDVVVHLAAMNRHQDPQVLYETNIKLVHQLIEAMESEHLKPHVLFSSSIQEERDNEYGKSKREGRELLERWASRNNASFTGMVVPNVFGPFGQPNYNSFISTFCYKLTHGDSPQVIQDSDVQLIYVGSFCNHIIDKIRATQKSEVPVVERDNVPNDFDKKVTEILSLFEQFKTLYFEQGYIPKLKDINDINLFNTFRCYIDNASRFPVKLIKRADERGVFVETIRLEVGGQISFSITVPGITRGNHYHTRKIERFAIIKGKARIQLRRIGTDEVLDFYLDGDDPSYVDIPIWYTHNITNIGTEEMYTQFWINEWYNPEDADTYFEVV